MYALSVKQPWAELIARGEKRTEERTWTTRHRGDLLIVASKTPEAEEVEAEGLDPAALVYGAAVCVVNVSRVTGEQGEYEWHLSKPRRVKPLPLRGSAALYKVAETAIVYTGSKRQEPMDAGPSPVAPPPRKTSADGATKRARPRRPGAAALPAMLGPHDVDDAGEGDAEETRSVVVILADDDAKRRRATQALLRDEDVDVRVATTPAKLLELGSDVTADWLVVSSSFAADGYRELVMKVRAVPAMKRTKRILLAPRGSVTDLAGAFLVETPDAVAEKIAGNHEIPEMLRTR